MEITLDKLLASRDERHCLQLELLQQHPTCTLVCLTVIMPGRIKRNQLSLTVAQAATDALLTQFSTKRDELLIRDQDTGYEAYLLTRLPVGEAKRITSAIEEQHPLGRLFDIDVINRDGTPVSRETIGLPQRRCLLCDQSARYCMRNHTHTQEEIALRIRQLVDDYLGKKH